MNSIYAFYVKYQLSSFYRNLKLFDMTETHSSDSSAVITKKDISFNTTNNVYMTILDINRKVVELGNSNKSGKVVESEAQKLYNKAVEIKEAQITKLKTASKFPLIVKDVMIVNWKDNTLSVGYSRKVEDSHTFEDTQTYNQWVKDCEKLYNKQLEEVKNNVSTYHQTNIKREDAASALSTLLADDNFNKIRELEKNLEYRKFYFPGGVPKLKILPEGKETGPIGDSWDPRYLQDYIDQAQNSGFHRWFLRPMVGRNFVEVCSVGKVYDDCKGKIDWITKRYNIEQYGDEYKLDLASMFVGMKYMGKFQVFVDYVKTIIEEGINITVKTCEDVYKSFGPSITNPLRQVIVNWIGQNDFVKSDIGYYAQVDQLAFDAAQIITELKARNEEYEKFKEKLWNILKENPILQLCTNNAQITGVNIKLTQTMSCSQQIIEKGDDNDDVGEEEEVDDEELVEDDVEEEVEDDVKPVTTEPSKEPKTKKPKDDKKGMSTTTIVIIVIVSVLVVGGLLVGAWFIMKDKGEEQINEMNGGFVMLS